MWYNAGFYGGYMKLSKEAKEWAESIYDEKAKKIGENAVQERRNIMAKLPLHSPPAPIVGHFVEVANSLALEKSESYIRGYQQDEVLIDDEDKEEIINEIRQVINNYRRYCLGELKGMMTMGFPTLLDSVSETMERKFDKILGDVNSTLEVGVKNIALKLKKQPAKAEVIKFTIPDFSFMHDERYRKIVIRDYEELVNLNPDKAPKSMLIIAGGIIEALLIDALIVNNTFTYEKASEKFLKELIHPALTANIIKHDRLTDVLRVFRNLVHPTREIREGLVLSKEEARHSLSGVDVIISEVKAWYATLSTPPIPIAAPTQIPRPTGIVPIIPEDKKGKPINLTIMPSFVVEIIKGVASNVNKETIDPNKYEVKITNVGNGSATNLVFEDIKYNRNGWQNPIAKIAKITAIKAGETKILKITGTAYNPDMKMQDNFPDAYVIPDIYNQFNEKNPWKLKLHFQDMAVTKYTQEIEIGANVSTPGPVKSEP